ncbi:DUF4410 domain-containing protein [bacterium]|nr:DUF4410 domain-containing protein [bacterium]
MRMRGMWIIWMLSLLLLTGCARGPQAPLAPSGQKIEIQVFNDRGDPDQLEPRQYQLHAEVARFMEPDLIRRLQRAGYDARLLNSRDEFQPAPGRYLLAMKMVRYNAGSSAARMMVGFGAGAASLDNHYEFLGSGCEPVLVWDDGAGTSEHWSRIPRKLNANAVQRITAKLQTMR